jgi:hypothetical protein
MGQCTDEKRAGVLAARWNVSQHIHSNYTETCTDNELGCLRLRVSASRYSTPHTSSLHSPHSVVTSRRYNHCTISLFREGCFRFLDTRPTIIEAAYELQLYVHLLNFIEQDMGVVECHCRHLFLMMPF